MLRALIQSLRPHQWTKNLVLFAALGLSKHLFEADYLHDQLGALVNTGVRNNGLLNIKPADFMNVRVPVPPMAEQHTIAKVLDAASAEIALRERELAALQQQKRALMQQLLTGKRRVRLSDGGSDA